MVDWKIMQIFDLPDNAHKKITKKGCKDINLSRIRNKHGSLKNVNVWFSRHYSNMNNSIL